MERYDFSGWATKNDIKCTDGRTIRQGAFRHCDGKKVPLVWMHNHNDVSQVLGHALLENRDDGVYAYGVFNDTEAGQAAKILVHNGDVNSLSIWANHLQQDAARNVMHGDIKELSLVLAGANSGATIENVLEHYDEDEFEANICMHSELTLYHDDEDEDPEELDEEDEADEELQNDGEDTETEEELEHADKEDEEDMGAESEKTVQDVVDTMNEEQKNVLYALVGMAAEGELPNDEEGDDMRHSVFEDYDMNEDVISHDDMVAIFDDVKRYGTLKESALQHGVENLELLFPDDRAITNEPVMVSRDMGWVDRVMNSVHKTPFSKVKSLFADITEDDARAKGYIKGNFKKEEVFTLLKRNTAPTTIYKKQKFDRDDMIDIVDFDMVGWVKKEMRMMLNEEIARAILVGDGRPTSSDDHISEENIRPIWKDEDFFSIKVTLDKTVNASDPDAIAKNFIRKAIKARKDYKGSGSPVLYTTEDLLTDMLLLTDETGRDLYDEAKLKSKLRVSDIVTVPVMEGLSREEKGKTRNLLGIIVNLSDYNYGADKGGAVTLFDDFDIDYNAQKYLIETRGSGALIKPFSAMVIEMEVANG